MQDFRDSIKDDACRAQVHKYQQLAAQDIRFNPSLADACFEDRTTLCANVPPVRPASCSLHQLLAPVAEDQALWRWCNL